VYKELVKERWLVSQGQSFIVVERRLQEPVLDPSQLDTFIDRLIVAGRAAGLSGEDLVARLKQRAIVDSPDHLLIVEPEPGMGEVMRYEVRTAAGQTAVSYPVEELKCRPELLARAKILVPAHLFDLMGFVPAVQLASAIVLQVSSFDSQEDQVRQLKHPSIIGMLTVSLPGLRTMAGEIAECIGTRHRLLYFLMELPSATNGAIKIHRWTEKFEAPEFGVRQRAHGDGDPLSGYTSMALARTKLSSLPLATMEDLQSVDLMLCDSITHDAVRHKNRIKYQMISPKSLEEVAAIQLASRVKTTRN
jgi:hypothetical protein